MAKLNSKPLKLSGFAKHDVRTQFGALCWRSKKGAIEVALITTRRTRRWSVPKGWPMNGASPPEAAAKEALEEAGLEGRVGSECLGIYTYFKEFESGRLPCVVALFPLRVKKVRRKWPEAGQRARRWVSPKKASNLVDNPELKRILRGFDPRATG